MSAAKIPAKTKILKTCVILAALAGAGLSLAACAEPGPGYERTRLRVDVSQHDEFGRPYGRCPDCDRDGDGVPNWADNHPNNPYRP